jgi:hypothetical protein
MAADVPESWLSEKMDAGTVWSDVYEPAPPSNRRAVDARLMEMACGAGMELSDGETPASPPPKWAQRAVAVKTLRDTPVVLDE